MVYKKSINRKKNYKKKFKKTKKFIGGKPNDVKTESKKEDIQLDNESSKEAIAVASANSSDSKFTDIPKGFIQGVKEQYGPEIDKLKIQLKDKLDKAAAIIKELSSNSEEWNSPENQENIRILKENTLKQIDNIGIPVAAGAAKIAGTATGTVVKETMMASGILEVVAALKLAIGTLNTVVDLMNKLGVTEKMAPLVQKTIGKAIEIISNLKIPNKDDSISEFTAKANPPVTRTITDQEVEVKRLNTGEVQNIKIEQQEGEKKFITGKK